jgi:ATP-binding cassette subfamily B protein
MISRLGQASEPPSLSRYFVRMWRFAPLLCLGHALAWGLINLTGLAPGVLVARYLDLIEADGTRTELIEIVVAIVALAIFWFVLVLLGGYLEIQMRFRMSGLVRFNLFRTLLDRYGAAPLPYPIGQTISRFRDDGYAAEDVLDWTNEIILHTLFGMVALIAIAMIDMSIAMAVITPMLAVVLGTHLLGSWITTTRQASSQATSEITGAIAGMLAATTAIKTAGAEQRVVARLAELNHQRRALMVRDSVATTVVSAIGRSAAGITTGTVMLVAADNVRSGEISIGEFALFLIWIGFLTRLTSEISAYLAFLRQAQVAFQRLDALLDGVSINRLSEHNDLHLRGPLPSQRVAAAQRVEPLMQLTVENLTCVHPGSEARAGILNATFSLQRGSFTVITGKIGSGKTTLLRGILGLLPIDKGAVRWNHGEIDDLRSFMTPPRVAYVPQTPHLMSTTLRENILMGSDVAASALNQAIERAVLDLDVAAFRDGLDTRIGTHGLRLSGGQAIRTATARALIHQPELLVIDDATSALDVETERLFWNQLCHNTDQTILAVSHRKQAMLLADQIIVLDRGSIVARGTLAELLKQSVSFREIWERPDPEHPEERGSAHMSPG